MTRYFFVLLLVLLYPLHTTSCTWRRPMTAIIGSCLFSGRLHLPLPPTGRISGSSRPNPPNDHITANELFPFFVSALFKSLFFFGFSYFFSDVSPFASFVCLHFSPAHANGGWTSADALMHFVLGHCEWLREQMNEKQNKTKNFFATVRRIRRLCAFFSAFLSAFLHG